MQDSKPKTVIRVILALAMMGIGISHFTAPGDFVRIVPAWLPHPWALVVVSGLFEVLGGLGMLVPRARRLAALGLVLLYVAVFPANINMAIHQIQPTGITLPVWAFWARLPFQALFIGLAIWCGNLRQIKKAESPT